MAIRDGLLGNPVLSGLLARGGPVAIQQAANQQIARMQQRPQAARLRAPGAINLPPDNSVGQGLSQLGKALGDIADMKAESAAQKDLSALFEPKVVGEPSTGQSMTVQPKVSGTQLANFLAKHTKAPNASKQAGMLYNNAIRQEAESRDQDFRREILSKKQDFTADQADEERRFRKDMQDDKIAAEKLSGYLNRSSKLTIARLSRDARVEAAKIGANANKKNKTANLMTYGEFRSINGSIGLTGGKEKYNDSDPMMVTYNSDGTLSGAKFLDNQQAVSNVGIQDKQTVFEAGKKKTPEQNPENVLPKTDRDMKGAVGFITGPVLSALDRIGSGIGITSGETAAAADFVENVNKRVTATGAIVSQILKKGGRESNYTRELTASILPKRGLFDSEISFQNELTTTIQNLKNVRAEMLEVVNDGSYSVQDRNVAKQQMVAMQNHIFEYEDMLKAMKPESQQNNSANINSADAIVGINQ